MISCLTTVACERFKPIRPFRAVLAMRTVLRPLRRAIRLSYPSLLYLMLGDAPLKAQTTSAIQGTVMDPDGNCVAGASIKLFDPVSAFEATTRTDSVGDFRIAGLRAGNYILRLSKQGFATKVYAALPITVNQVLVFDVVLALGSLQQELTVRALPRFTE